MAYLNSIFKKLSLRIAISYLLAVLLLVNFVDGAVPQLEMYLLKGHCPLPTGTVKILVLLVLISSLILLKSRVELSREFFIYASVVIFYFGLETLNFLSRYDITYIMFSYENYYYYLLLIPLFLIVRPKVAHGFWSKSMFVMMITLGGLGFMQGYTGEAIVRRASTDGNFLVSASDFFGMIRAFSLFTNAGTFGNFLSLSAAFLVISFIKSGRFFYKCFYLIFFVFLVIVTFMTYARSVYYEFILSALAGILMFSGRVRFGAFIPIIYGIMGFILIFSVPLLEASFGRTIFGVPLLDNTTHIMRIMEWPDILSRVTNSPATFLFGTDLIQSGQYTSIFSGSIDNIFLAVLLHVGLVGLLLYLLIMQNLWKICLQISRESQNVFALASVCTFSTWMILGMFTIQPTGFPLIFVLGLMASGCYTAPLRQRNTQLNTVPA